MLIVLQHLYFNNKTSSAPSSFINASESLSDSSSSRIEFKGFSTGLRIDPFFQR